FVLRKGPLFCNVPLADEVNRAPAKTQSALLEAMQEIQVTIEGTTLLLPHPFMVLATQNPVEQEGVYRLPEAQLDRFLLRVEMGYPGPKHEINMLKLHSAPVHVVQDVFTPEVIIEMQQMVTHVYGREELLNYIVDLAEASREGKLPEERRTPAAYAAGSPKKYADPSRLVVLPDVPVRTVPVAVEQHARHHPARADPHPVVSRRLAALPGPHRASTRPPPRG